MRKKTKNPFKMWGSWIGAIILYPIILILDYNNFNIMSNISKSIANIFGEAGTSIGNNVFAIIFLILPAIFGFLIGYGIQLLWRKFRK